MPKVTFSAENKVKQNDDLPVLKLDYNERALIVPIEAEPEMLWVHTLQAPQIGPDGKVLKETRVNQKTKEEYEAVQKEFIGKHVCFGNFDVMAEKGADPANCPTCKAALEGDGVEAAIPRYAMNVLRYSLQPGGFEVRDPFNVTAVVWVFPPGKFNQLIELAQEWGDLRTHDLKLGPCENKNYQKYEINVSAKAVWMQSEENKKQALAEYQNNRIDDLSPAIGRKITKEQAMQDIERVQERVQQAYHTPASSLPAAVQNDASASISSDVAAALGEDKPAAEATQTQETEKPSETAAMSFEDVLAGL